MVLFFHFRKPQIKIPNFFLFFLSVSLFLSVTFLPLSPLPPPPRRENQQSSSFQKIGERDARYGYRIYIGQHISLLVFPLLLNPWPSILPLLPHHAYIGTTLYLARTTPYHTTPRRDKGLPHGARRGCCAAARRGRAYGQRKPLREKARCSRGVGILTAWKVDRQARLGGQVGRCSGGTYVVRDLYGSLSRNNACVCIWRGGRGGGGPGGPQ